MESLQQQLKRLAKDIEKGLNKELAKANIKVKYRTEGQNMGFNILDNESEKYLRDLLSDDNIRNVGFRIEEKTCETASIVQNLVDCGYLESDKGVQYFLGGDGFICIARLTQKAKSYDELKEKFENMTKNNSNSTNNFNAPITHIEGGIHNSTVQIATNNSSIEITNELTDEVLKEISDKIETYGLSDDDKQELKDLVDDVKEKQQKKPNLVKRGLKAIWDFAKDVGCGVLAAYISNKCGF